MPDQEPKEGDAGAPVQGDEWVVVHVQERLALHGSWDGVQVSDSSRGEGQWLFRISRGPHSHVFAVPTAPVGRDEVNDLVDQAVAAVGPRSNGTG